MGKNIPKHIGAGEGERVRVTILQRRKSIEEHRNQKIRNAIRSHQLSRPHYTAKKAVAGTKQKRLRSAKEFMLNASRRERLERKVNMRVKHLEKATLETPVTGGALLAVRTKGSTDVSRITKILLEKYRLSQLHDAVILPSTKDVAEDMHVLQDYVLAGSLSQEQLSDLVKHHARYRDDKGNLLPLDNNLVVENHLEAYGLLCVEDLIHALELGEKCKYFWEAARFILPFKLAPPKHVERRDNQRSLFEKRNKVARASVAQFYMKQLKRGTDAGEDHLD